MTTATALRIRPYAGASDVADIVRVYNAAAAADRVEEVWTEEGLAAWLAHPSEQFDPSRDAVLGELDGRVVAVGRVDWVDNRDGRSRDYRSYGTVEPDFHGRGFGTALLGALEERLKEIAASHSHDREAVLMSFAPAGRPSEALLRANGYAPVRWFIDMVRPTLDGIVEPPMPDGIELRPVTPDQHETIWRANREAFRDHWGGSDESLDAMRRLLDEPHHDPSLWLVAWDGDEVAGGVWNEVNPEENESLGIERGWLASVFTRRAWRRRGLAAALIGQSLELLRDRGLTSAALGVDADNPSGALGLYEAAGFEIHERFTAWRRPLEDTR